MEIKVLEVGCSKCKVLLQRTLDVAKQLGIEENVESISDISEISKFGVMNLPALVINGEVKSAGKVPKSEQIIEWLNAHR